MAHVDTCTDVHENCSLVCKPIVYIYIYSFHSATDCLGSVRDRAEPQGLDFWAPATSFRGSLFFTRYALVGLMWWLGDMSTSLERLCQQKWSQTNLGDKTSWPKRAPSNVHLACPEKNLRAAASGPQETVFSTVTSRQPCVRNTSATLRQIIQQK